MVMPIKSPCHLVHAASKEGFAMSENAANVIIGYMDGHGYELGTNEGYGVFRNDLAFEQSKSHWEPYSVRDAILFAYEMCKGIQEEQELESNPDESYIRQLLTDEETLAPLYEAAMKLSLLR